VALWISCIGLFLDLAVFLARLVFVRFCRAMPIFLFFLFLALVVYLSSMLHQRQC